MKCHSRYLNIWYVYPYHIADVSRWRSIKTKQKNEKMPKRYRENFISWSLLSLHPFWIWMWLKKKENANQKKMKYNAHIKRKFKVTFGHNESGEENKRVKWKHRSRLSKQQTVINLNIYRAKCCPLPDSLTFFCFFFIFAFNGCFYPRRFIFLSKEKNARAFVT